MSPIEPKRIEVLDPLMVQVWRDKPPRQRVDLALETSRSVRDVMAGGIQARHPDWGPDQVQSELSRRMLRGSA